MTYVTFLLSKLRLQNIGILRYAQDDNIMKSVPISFDTLTTQMLIAFILIMFRVMALMMTAPVLSRHEFPIMIKIGFAGVMSFSLFNDVISHSTNLIPTNPWLLSIVIAFEIVIGAILGMLISLLFDGIATFAQVVGMQMGGSASNIFEPSLNTGANPIAQFYLYASLSIFLILGGFYNVFAVLAKSFTLAPLGDIGFNFAAFALNYLDIFSAIFISALKLMMPLLAVMTITDIFVALVAKILPQANIYFLIMPNKLILGMIIMSLTMGGLAAGVENYVEEGLLDNFSQLFS